MTVSLVIKNRTQLYPSNFYYCEGIIIFNIDGAIDSRRCQYNVPICLYTATTIKIKLGNILLINK